MALPVVFGEVFKEGEDILLSVAVRLDGAPSISINCNVTVEDPSSKIIIFFQQTINNATTQRHEFLLDGSNTSSNLGEYCYEYSCSNTNNNVNKTVEFCLDVTPNGAVLSTAESVLYIFLAIFNAVAAVLFLFYGVTIPYSDDRNKEGTITRLIPFKYLKLLSIWIGYGSLLWLSSIITLIVNNFVSIESARTLMTNLNSALYIFGYIISVVILSILIIQVYWDMFVPIFRRFFMKVTKKRSATI